MNRSAPPLLMSPCAEKFYFRKKGGGIIMEQTKIREQVIDDLKQYPELKKKVILLRYEQEHPAKISDSEVIDSMALSRPVSFIPLNNRSPSWSSMSHN